MRFLITSTKCNSRRSETQVPVRRRKACVCVCVGSSSNHQDGWVHNPSQTERRRDYRVIRYNGARFTASIILGLRRLYLGGITPQPRLLIPHRTAPRALPRFTHAFPQKNFHLQEIGKRFYTEKHMIRSRFQRSDFYGFYLRFVSRRWSAGVLSLIHI